MNIETIKWIYQRASTPIIIVLFFWFVFKIYYISNYNYETIYIFFKNYLNLFFFVLLLFLSLVHTSIEVFHSIHDYFAETKNENHINYLVKILYLIIFLSIIIFITKIIIF